MKKILFIAAFLLFARIANAQQNQLALDEHNKYVYYQVVEIPDSTQDNLYRNAAFFLKDEFPKGKQTPTATQNIVFKDKFLCYAPFVKHETGAIAYTLNIECKDSKYRYWLTDFIFTPYQRDRYGVFVPENGIEIPLEKASTKVDKKDLDSYLEQTTKFCTQLGTKLRKYMAGEKPQKKPAEQPAKKIVTDKW